METVPDPRLQGGVGIGRYELRRPGMVLRQVLDDGGRFGDREAGSLLAQHRELRQRPHRRKGRARLRVAEVDDLGLEGDGVLVEGDEDLLAVRREGVRSEEHTSELQSLMRISYAV